MDSRKLTGYYEWAIKIIIFIIPFLSVWISSSMFFPYITGRNFAFRILVEIALVLWVGLIVLRREYAPKWSPIAIAVAAFTLVVGVANLFGIDPFMSFWSRFERMEGYLMILHLAAYFFIASSVFRTKKDWMNLFNLVIIAGLIVGSYGILQVLGIKEAIQGGDVRIDGTIGNPTYLAAYLTFVIALSLMLFFNADKLWKKWFYGFSCAFSFFVMFFTASRGAALAFLISVPLFLILYLIFYRKTEDPKEKFFKKIVIAGLAFMVLAPSALWLLKDTGFVQGSSVLSRVTSVSFQERTIKSRFQIWGIAWKAFQEHPVLGWGQESFLTAFSKHYDPRLYDQEPWFDRPHNIIFEWLINAGIVGLVAYLSLFATLFWGIITLFRKKIIGNKEALVLLVAPVTYFLQNFFVFDNFNTYVLFFGLLAYVSCMLSEKNATLPVDERKVNLSLWVVMIGSLVMVVIMYFVNFIPIAQSRGIISSLQATAGADPLNNTLAGFKKVLSYGPFGRMEAIEQLARVAGLLSGQSSVPDQQKIPFLEFALRSVENFAKEHPTYIRVRIMLGSLYQALRGFNPDFVFKARDEFKAALELSPKKQQTLFILADSYLSTNELGKAIEVMQQAVALEPSNIDAHVNLSIVAIYGERGDLAAKAISEISGFRKNYIGNEQERHTLWAQFIAIKRIGEAYLRVSQRSNARNAYAVMETYVPDFVRVGVAPEGYLEALADLDNAIRE